MIKILVNNEEVVCSNNISIKEEMLSTSSTILKNCYPKSWELDKDYVSRYYFPKDYSKCKITDDVYHPEVIGTRVSGTNFTINYNNTLDWKLEELKGNTQQNGTPTPDTPVEIQSVTGLQNINVCGKNLFNANNNTYKDTWVTHTIDNTNKITVTNSYSWARLETTIKNLKPNTNYTISTDITNASGLNCGLWSARDLSNLSTNTNFKSSITKQSDSSGNLEFYFYVNYSGTTTSTGTVTFDTIQIEENTQATSYEPYKGNTYEINLGKNLFDKNAEMYGSGVRKDVLNTGVKLVQSSSGTYKYKYLKIGSNELLGEKITISSTITPNASNIGCIALYFGNSTNASVQRIGDNITTSGSNTITIPNSFPNNSNGIYLFLYSNLNGTGAKNDYVEYTNLQLEKGSIATSFSPYFTPIELNKIGNYQDYIRKSTGKNLFDKDNVENNYRLDSNGDAISSNGFSLSDYIEVKPNTTYTISRDNISNYFNNISEYSNDKTHLLRSYTTATTFTITTQSTTKYIRISDATSNLNIMQFEQGNTATDLEPYGVGKWYKYSAIGKVVLDGSGNWSLVDSSTRFATTQSSIPNIANALINTSGSSSNLTPALSDYFTVSIQNNITKTSNNFGFSKWGNSVWIYFSAFKDTVEDFKTWLSNNKPEIDFVLATPQVEVITNEELINQLESIELLKETNNITITSENLPMIMQLYYNYKEAYTSEDLLFCGCVKNTGKISLNPREPHFVDLQVLDFKTLLSEGETLNYVITGKTIVEAINQVVNSISDYGFVVGNIEILNPNDIINAYSTLNKTAYDIFQYIADITQSRWTTRTIDENTIAIDFYDPTLMPSGTPIESTQQYYEDNNIIDISFNYSTNDYRNKQIMTSDEVYANITQTETIIADGYTQNFMCQNKLGIIETITVNGVSKTFATKSEQELGITADFYYQPGEMQFVSSNTIGTGIVIVITYYPIVKGREIILNTGESTRIETQIGRKGTLSRYENRNDTTSSQELQKIGQSYIKYKGQAEIQLKVKTKTNLWDVGEILSYNAPLEELSTEYMVKSKEVDWYAASDETFYIYELTSNFNYENAVNYFDNQRAKNQGNIGEGETITRNIDLINDALILFYDTDVEEIQVLNPTSLDFALDGVLI